MNLKVGTGKVVEIEVHITGCFFFSFFKLRIVPEIDKLKFLLEDFIHNLGGIKRFW